VPAEAADRDGGRSLGRHAWEVRGDVDDGHPVGDSARSTNSRTNAAISSPASSRT
jgi:hypothetical protein